MTDPDPAIPHRSPAATAAPPADVEPTADSHRPQRTTREEVARIEVGSTQVSTGVKWGLIVLFLGTIFAVPLAEQVRAIARHGDGRQDSPLPPSWAIVPALGEAGTQLSAGDGGAWQRLLAANAGLLRAMSDYEDDLEHASLLQQLVLPPMQAWLVRLGAGNEEAYVGRDGWLFYRPDVDYVTGPGFLDERQLARRASGSNEWQDPPQGDPRKAILQFRDQLAARGIRLIVLPTPVKPVLHPQQLSSRHRDRSAVVHNPSYTDWLDDMQAAGVEILDVDDLLAERMRSGDDPAFLRTDTHWTPQAMQLVAARLAGAVARTAGPTGTARTFRTQPHALEHLGDVAAMLRLPPSQRIYPPQRVTVRAVYDESGEPIRPDPAADVLLLGDSFSNIYSAHDMGWGQAAGLGEHLALGLGRPVDAIIRNDAGAYATRQELSRELARGHDRLAGKRVVVWQFAVRELASGDWRLVPMDLADARQTSAPPTPPGLVRARIASISRAPRPGSVPYANHLVTAHLAWPGGDAVVYMVSMRDHVWTPAARLRAGDEITVRLQPWSDVSDVYGGWNRAELDDLALEQREPLWAQLVDDRAAPQPSATPVEPTTQPALERQPVPEMPPTPAPATGAWLARFGAEAGRLAAEAIEQERLTVVGQDGWLFLSSELRHLAAGEFWGDRALEVSRSTRPQHADPTDAIVDFHQQLAGRGIELIFLPIPPKAAIVPERLADGVDVPLDADGRRLRVDAAHAAFYEHLRRQGVTVLDLSADWSQRADREALYCRTDTHFSPLGAQRAARAVAAHLGERSWLGGSESFQTEQGQVTIRGDLAAALPEDVRPGEETLAARFVGRRDGDRLLPVPGDADSPVPLLGDSHTLVFHVGGDLHARGAGLGDQLAAELGTAVEVMGVRGSGATPARLNLYRRAAADAQWLAGKRVVIWCLSARDFTEATGGWMKVPVAP